MHNFFDVNLFQNIASGLVVLFVSILLGSRTSNGVSNGKGWKVVIVLSWVMILGGLYMAGVNQPNGGIMQNPYVGMGLSIAFLGWIIKLIGKFFHWWHR